MAFLSSFDISGYGLSAQRVRVNTISSNIANANTTRTDEGGPYRRKEVVFRAINFDKMLNDKIAKNENFLPFEDPLNEGLQNQKAIPSISSVVIDKIVQDDKNFKLKYDPSHPDADANGYVAYPNVNPVVEMADLIEATRAYQANVSAFQSAKTMASNAITMFQA